MPKKTIYYNKTNVCDGTKEDGEKCKNKLYPHNAYKEYKYEKLMKIWTKNWLCKSCYSKDYDKNNSNSRNNILKSIGNCRTGNQDEDSAQAKGKKSQKLACKSYGWIDLNEKNDNYSTGTPIDCYDPKTGLYHQVQWRSYDDYNKCWNSGGKLEREWYKEFTDMVFYCADRYGRIIERIYIFPIEEIRKRTGITIYKNPKDRWGNPITPWYEKYRVKDEDGLKKANELWEDINIR